MSSVSPPPSPPPGVDQALPIAARRDRFVAHVARRLRRRCGVRGGDAVAVGLSGGADSVSLLTALTIIRDRACERTRIPLLAVHIHHHLRGPSADEDAAFAASTARRLGVPFAIRHIDPAEFSGNVAAAARAHRYAALGVAAREAGATHVAVGHHADDQLETMLIALCRGAGLTGLGGMPWTRTIDEGIDLIRPLLDTPRSACEAFCALAGTGWRDDPSNADPAHLRGRVRRDLLPAIEAIWPGAAARTTGTADAVTAAQLATDDIVSRVFGPVETRAWPRAALAALPPALMAIGLRRAALDADGALADTLGQRLLLQAAEAVADDEKRPRRYTWPRGVHLSITSRDVTLET